MRVPTRRPAPIPIIAPATSAAHVAIHVAIVQGRSMNHARTTANAASSMSAAITRSCQPVNVARIVFQAISRS